MAGRPRPALFETGPDVATEAAAAIDQIFEGDGLTSPDRGVHLLH